MMWMPLRAPKMKLFILGFQRLVWWPKWTPASIISRMVIGASPGAGCAISSVGVAGVGVEVSVLVSMRVLFCVVFRRPCHRGPQPEPPFERTATQARNGHLDRRVVFRC